MILSTLYYGFWLFVIFLIVGGTCAFLHGMFQAIDEQKEPAVEMERIETFSSPSTIIHYEPQAIRVRAGHFEINYGNGQKSTIHKFEPEGQRIYWVLTLPNGRATQYWTKKKSIEEAMKWR